MPASAPLLPRREGRGFLRSGLWFIPIMSLVGASLLALLTTAIDRRLAAAGEFAELFTRNPEAIRSALSIVASSILTFTALVFSVTMLVVQQASSQLSPRVVHRFLEDRISQATLGVFLGTFAYTLLVLRDIRSPAEGISFVPGISVALVFVAVLASLTMFVAYLNNVTESVQVGTVADRIARATVNTARQIFEAGLPLVDRRRLEGFSGDDIRWDGTPGPVRGIDIDRLRSIAATQELEIGIHVMIGDHLRPGRRVMTVSGTTRGDLDWLTEVIHVGPRTLDTDVRFGLRQLVDIAVRALSPGVNDPTTAVQVMNRIGDVLTELASHRLTREPEALRVLAPTWDDYVALGFDEIRFEAVGSLGAASHLEALLKDLAGQLGPDRSTPLLERHRVVRQAIRDRFGSGFTRDSAGSAESRAGTAS